MHVLTCSLVIVGICIAIFFWAVNSGQYDDMDGPAHSILFDDEDPKHQAGIDEAEGADSHASQKQDKRDA